MKKIIKGKVYDTGAAELIGKEDYLSGTGYFNWFIDRLYRKRSGEFFLHGQGGAFSKYLKTCGDLTMSGGNKFTPLSFAQAQEWANEKLSSDDAAIKHFNEIEINENRKTVGISIAVSTHEKAKRQASIEGISLSEFIENLILASIK